MDFRLPEFNKLRGQLLMRMKWHTIWAVIIVEIRPDLLLQMDFYLSILLVGAGVVTMGKYIYL